MLSRLAILLLTLNAGDEPPLSAEEPGWYHLELESGGDFTARLISEEESFYLFSFQGQVLNVAKSGVRKFERVELERREARETPAPHGDGPDGDAASPDLRLEEALRDAIEALSSIDEEAVKRAYTFITKEFAAARPLVHIALSHRHPRVRLLCTKALGETGTPEKDLAAAAGRLSDQRPDVRLAAVMAVRALGPGALPELVEYLGTETVPNNRKMAVKTFQRWNDARAVAPLVDRLAHEGDGEVQDFIACALEAITGQKLGRDPEVWASYLIQARHARDEEVTHAALTERRAAPGEDGESKE